MKKLLIISLIAFSCSKRHDVTYNNPTDTDLWVELDNNEGGFKVLKYDQEMMMERNGTFTIHVHSSQHYTDYTEVVTVGKENLTVNLHK